MSDRKPREPGQAEQQRPQQSRRQLRLSVNRVGERRSGRPLLIAIGIHLVLGVVLVRAITFGHGIRDIFGFRGEKPIEERVTYVEQAPPKVAVVPVKPVVPPTKQPQVAPVAPPQVSAPVAPPPPAKSDTASGGGGTAATGTGNGASGVGVPPAELRGVQPAYGDARVWGAAQPGAPLRRKGTERLDSIIATAIVGAADSLDSIARAEGRTGRAPGDWTRTDKDGHKWGWDPTGVRLGKVTIPNALLVLLPLNAQKGMMSNPTAVERNRRLDLARRDIMNNAQLGPGDDQFKKLAKELRDRKEREHQAKQKEQQRIATKGGGN